tara:strand:- start:324 stop:545 length:222 start_codon:yes stop_codon:yes gene_type:complete
MYFSALTVGTDSEALKILTRLTIQISIGIGTNHTQQNMKEAMVMFCLMFLMDGYVVFVLKHATTRADMMPMLS